MTLIHHVASGDGQPPIVFVHGFACAHSDWDAQVAHLSPRHRTVAVDLRGHGDSAGEAGQCSIERYGADVAEVMRAQGLAKSILVGHSMGCRVVVEAALQAPALTAGVILVDGSQFEAEMAPIIAERCATPDGYAALSASLFKEMFTTKGDSAVARAIIARAARLPRPIGEKMLLDMIRYDIGRLTWSLRAVRVPVMAVQATWRNERRERAPMHRGQTSPYLDMLRTCIPGVRVEIIEETGHFPQLDESQRVNALIDDFVAGL